MTAQLLSLCVNLFFFCASPLPMVWQITAALRNLAVDSHHRKVFLDAAVIENLRPYLTSHMIETEVMLNISRILRCVNDEKGKENIRCHLLTLNGGLHSLVALSVLGFVQQIDTARILSRSPVSGQP